MLVIKIELNMVLIILRLPFSFSDMDAVEAAELTKPPKKADILSPLEVPIILVTR